MSNISEFLVKLGEIRKTELCPAQEFNVFRLCGVDHYELWHSKIIAHFLSPQGTHGFKGEFLRAFALYFGLGEYSDSAIVRTEVSARSHEINFGRFDILIEDETTRNTCLIENKIFASEQTKQLERYTTWLRQKKGWKAYLAFLSLDGRSAESLDDGYVRVAYYASGSGRKSVFMWADRCAKIAKKVPCIRETLCQYRNHIKEIATGRSAMDAEIVTRLKNSMYTAEKVFRNYSTACLSLANRILMEDVKARLDEMYENGWQCESGLSFSRRESGVLYRPSVMPSAKEIMGQIYVIFAETGLVQCQIGLWQDIKGNNRIVDDNIFKSAVSKIGLKKDDGWRICESKVGDEPWPAWCPILMGNNTTDCQNGIDWNGEFFDSYSNDPKFKNCLLDEIAMKVGQLNNLQLAIS